MLSQVFSGIGSLFCYTRRFKYPYLRYFSDGGSFLSEGGRMKIALMGAWNTDSGASIHAELIGRAWVEKGIDLKVFTFYRHSYHGTAITKSGEEEENYVKRCFTVYSVPTPSFTPRPFLRRILIYSWSRTLACFPWCSSYLYFLR